MMMAAEAMTESCGTNPASDETTSRDLVLLAAIRAVRDGDADAFEIVMKRSERRVASLAWRILGDGEEVREALQETYLRVFRHIQRYDEAREFHAWLFRIAVNVCRDLERRRRKRSERHTELHESHALPERDHPDAVASRSEEIALLTRAVDALPPKQRLAIILRDVEGLPTEEVARILGSRAATVRVQVSTARSKLRSMIERWRRGGES